MKWNGDLRRFPSLFLFCGLFALATSCGGGSSQPASPTRELFVGDYLEKTVLVFDASSNGKVDPLWTISNIPVEFGSAFDTVDNEMFVADGNTSTATQTITVYPLVHGGEVQPLRQISSPLGTTFPQSVAIDAVHDEIFLLGSDGNSFSVAVYPRNASGETAPLRTIHGTAERVFRLAVDPANNEIYITNMKSILVFSRTADGTAVPLRTIRSDGSFMPYGVAVDNAKDEIFVTNPNFCLDTASCRVYRKIDPSIMIFPRSADGTVIPLRSITGTATSLASPTDIVVDPDNNELFVADGRSVNVYSRTSNGNAAPLRSISSDSIPTFYSITGLGLKMEN